MGRMLEGKAVIVTGGASGIGAGLPVMAPRPSSSV